jgi:hypothetical protein
MPSGDMTTASLRTDRFSTSRLFARTLAIGLVALCLWTAWTYPTAAVPLTVGLAAYAAVLLLQPAAWMFVLPAALPVLELSYWSGRLFFTEFDLLVLVTLASGLWHGGRWLAQIDRGTRRVAMVLLLSHAVITLHGLLPLYAPAPGAWDDYFASTNALREFRGLLWALLLWPMLGAARARGDDIQRWFAAGMVAGLVAAVASIVWERGLFTGLFDFSDPYRISGWFISMHTGGAAIDAFLAMTVPFALAPLFLWRNPLLRTTTLVLAAGGLYAFYVTYSRANYPALIAMLLVLVLGLSLAATRDRRRPPRARPLLPLMASFGAVATILLLLAISLGPNIENRFATSSRDMQTRLEHWSDVIDTAQVDPAANWIGRGKGRFAHDYYWQRQSQGQHLALALLHREQGETFVRFSPSDAGGTLYLRQRIDRTPSDNYRLELMLRTPPGKGEALLIEFCERHMLAFLAECRWRKVKVPAADGEWRDFTVNVDLRGLGLPRFGPFSRPLEVALMNRGIGSGMDIGAVQLYSVDGQRLLGNPDFTAGWDNWFLSYGDHLRWHIKNVFLHWFYEGGLVLVVIMLGSGIYVLARVGASAAAGDGFGLLSLVAIVGTMAVGLFDSLFDDVRVALLFFTLTGAALIARAPVAAVTTPTIRIPPRLLGRLAGWGSVAAAVLVIAYLVSPGLFRPVEAHLASWAEGRGSFAQRWLVRDYRAAARANLAKTVGDWQPGPDRGLAAWEIRIGERTFARLNDASRALQPGDTLEIGPGVYREPLVIRADGVHVSGSGHVVIERTQAEGKAAIITRGDGIVIENIECRRIRVRDGNGACVRHEGRDLTLRQVYFHDAQAALLTGGDPGLVRIVDSRFSEVGWRGRAHGIVVGGGELQIENSQVVAAKSWAHAIQSHARTTRIANSLIGSLGSNDSRLIDLPRGGVLEIRDSILQHGPVSANSEAIGFAQSERLHREQQIVLTGNRVVLERDGPDRLFEFGDHVPAMTLSGNLLINTEPFDDGGDNRYHDDRESAALPAFPRLPR